MTEDLSFKSDELPDDELPDEDRPGAVVRGAGTAVGTVVGPAVSPPVGPALPSAGAGSSTTTVATPCEMAWTVPAESPPEVRAA